MLKRCFLPLSDPLLPLRRLVWINMCMFWWRLQPLPRFSFLKQCAGQTQTEREEAVCYFSSSLPSPVLWRLWTHDDSSTTIMQKIEKSSLALLTGLTGTLCDTLRSTIQTKQRTCSALADTMRHRSATGKKHSGDKDQLHNAVCCACLLYINAS